MYFFYVTERKEKKSEKLRNTDSCVGRMGRSVSGIRVQQWTVSASLLAIFLIKFTIAASTSTITQDAIVAQFYDSEVERMNHLVVDKNTGRVYVGAVNKLYQFTPDLKLVVKEITGPKNDSPDCSMLDCPREVSKKLLDNVNKALVIDYTTSRLISCGSLFQVSMQDCALILLNYQSS